MTHDTQVRRVNSRPMTDVAVNPSTETERAPLLTCFLPQLSAGGAERVILAIAGELVQRGYRCDLVTAQAGGRWEGKVPAGVRDICLDRRKPLHAIPRLIAYLRRERPAALLSSVFSANVAAVAACQVSRTRCALREAFWAEQDTRSGGPLSRAVNTLALRMLYRRADAIIALTNELAAHIHEATGIPEGRITVIPNPHLALGADAMPPNRESDLILACGRLEPQKDFDTLLQAFALLSRERPARLVILGEGSQRQHLEQRASDLGISEAVRLAGYSDRVDDWMRRAKVFVSTSRSEGFPNVLLEAVAHGCDVVSTLSTDAVRDVLGDGGRVVEVGNAAAIAAALADALDAEPDAGLALRRIEARFDLQTIVDRYLQVLLPTPRGVNA